MRPCARSRRLIHLLVALWTSAAAVSARAEDPFKALREPGPPDPARNAPRFPVPAGGLETRVLLAGDSWAQLMWDDGSHNDILDKFGHGDKRALSLSRSDDPGPGSTGPEYAVGGSQARHWADTANYPWLQNLVTALQQNPSVDTVVLSIGGNDVLAGKSGGGWYKDMDLDVPGSEAAFFSRLERDTFTIFAAILAVRPAVRVLLSSYDYPNFNVGLLCFVSACPMRRNLSRDPNNDLITDAEINDMLVDIEQLRLGWTNSDPRLLYDNSLGLLHHYYGDGVSPPGILPHPGRTPPLYSPFPGGNPLRPTPRHAFRRPGGLDVDPIHLDYEGYQYKISNQTQATFFPFFRGEAMQTFVSLGGAEDGWCDGMTWGNDGVHVGRSAGAVVAGIVSFDTAALPDGATITAAALYLHRVNAQGTNPFASGSLGPPRLDVVRGSFGAPELESSDVVAPAAVEAAGALFGSALADGYVVRVEIGAAGLAAIHDAGRTQFRLLFAGPGGSGTDFVVFGDGDSNAPVATALPTLSRDLGTAAPFLDVTYTIPTAALPRPQALDAVLLAAPNPFAGATVVHFRLARPGRARLAVVDVAGRRVATLVDAVLPPGAHQATWDGRTTRGGRAGAGIYWALLQGDGGTARQRLVRLAP